VYTVSLSDSALNVRLGVVDVSVVSHLLCQPQVAVHEYDIPGLNERKVLNNTIQYNRLMDKMA